MRLKLIKRFRNFSPYNKLTKKEKTLFINSILEGEFHEDNIGIDESIYRVISKKTRIRSKSEKLNVHFSNDYLYFWYCRIFKKPIGIIQVS